MTSEEQLALWVEGHSIHNNDAVYHIVDEKENVIGTKKVEDGECCPDFSCCNPDLQWPKELRQKFKEADEAVRESMLIMSLSQVMASQGESINIGGDLIGGFVLTGNAIH